MGIVNLGRMGRSNIGTEEMQKVHHLPSVMFCLLCFI